MECVILGWPDDGITLDLDHEAFSYAGKFRMSSTGKAVARENGSVVGAVAFDPDRAREATARLRYVTVRADRRGAGIGPRLCAFVAERLDDRGFERTLIAVNNPFAYQALYRAGFAYTGERTGLAELVLERPGDRSSDRYQAGLAAFDEREGLSRDERDFLAENVNAEPPEPIDPMC